MAGIIKTSINLTAIDKSRIIEGKKGKYLPISITINDEVDQFGNFGPIIVDQTLAERNLSRITAVVAVLFAATTLSLFWFLD